MFRTLDRILFATPRMLAAALLLSLASNGFVAADDKKPAPKPEVKSDDKKEEPKKEEPKKEEPKKEEPKKEEPKKEEPKKEEPKKEEPKKEEPKKEEPKKEEPKKEEPKKEEPKKAAAKPPRETPPPSDLVLHERWVTSLSISGDLLATGGGQSLLYRPGDVMLWDLKTGARVAELSGHETNVWSVALSPDAKTLVSTGYDGSIIVWDVAQKASRATLEKKGWIRSVRFSPDGSQFATAQEDGSVTLWKTADATEIKTLKAHEAQVFQVAYSSDGAQLATASADKTVKLWDLASGNELAKLEGHSDSVWSVAFGPDGTVASGGADRQIKIWKDGKELASWPGHKEWISQLAFSPDGKVIAAADQGRNIKLWDVAGGECGATIGPLGGSQWAVAFTADGKLVTGGRKDCIRVWNYRPRLVFEFGGEFELPETKAETSESAAGGE